MTDRTQKTNSGNGALSLVNISDFGYGGFSYPTNPDTYLQDYPGHGNRYAAGTFAFQPVPEPVTFLTGLMVVSGLGAYIRRRTCAVAKA